MKLIEEKNTPLLKRKQVTYEVEHFKKPTPKKLDLIKELAKETKVSEDSIRLLHIYTKFGGKTSKIIANIYSSREDKENVEKINKNPKKRKKETTQPATPAQETKTEEKPAEEKKE